MAVPTDLRTLCSALEYFHFPSALGSVIDNRLLIWNGSFREMAEFSERELAEVTLGSLIALDESYDGLPMPDGNYEKRVKFVPCVLKKFGRLSPIREAPLDVTMGLLLVILNLPAGDLAFSGFYSRSFTWSGGREKSHETVFSRYFQLEAPRGLLCSLRSLPEIGRQWSRGERIWQWLPSYWER